MSQPGERAYIAIDLKSFYASVECRARGLDPLTTNLVVADESRTDKTICLAVSPSLKTLGISGRPRLFEVKQRIHQLNEQRRRALRGKPFSGSSFMAPELACDPTLEVGYITACPHMRNYMDVSSKICGIYLTYVSEEDMHVYSIDEVFIDVTPYLGMYGMSAHELACAMIRDVLSATGITATAGIGTNMYLAKVAMDIVAKHMPADADGVRIAELDEQTYRRYLWTHRPLTDFWRVGPGYAARLERAGMRTMGDVARQSVRDEEVLYHLFGVNAEYLIDHAWGVEPTTIADVRTYQPRTSNLGTGQVLPCAYEHAKARVVVREMAEELSYSLVEKGLVAGQVTLMVGYDRSGVEACTGPLAHDHYGRIVPAHAHGAVSLPVPTSSARLLTSAVLAIFDARVDASLPVRRLTVNACDVCPREEAERERASQQLTLFASPEEQMGRADALDEALARERRMQEQVAAVRAKFGKNAVLKGTDFREGARTRERNGQVGGHRE